MPDAQAHVGERTVTAVSIERAGHRSVYRGRRNESVLALHRRDVRGQVDFDVIPGVQVEQAVPVDVEEAGPRTTFFSSRPPAMVPGTPARSVASVNVPSPLLWYRTLGPKLSK